MYDMCARNQCVKYGGTIFREIRPNPVLTKYLPHHNHLPYTPCFKMLHLGLMAGAFSET